MALPTINTILYTTSLGKHTRPVFRHAVNLANQFNAKIVMLHVVEPLGEMGHALIQNYIDESIIKKMHDEGINSLHEEMRQRVEAFCTEELTSLPETITLNVEHVVVEGNHTDSILSQARAIKADLIVIGAENTFGHHSHTSQQVVKSAQVPVIVVPTGKKYD
ncbi:MAG: universal stress protein [Pontibacterium sp.]